MKTSTALKKLSITAAGATFVVLEAICSSASAQVPIDNGIPTGTAGSWSVDVLSGGQSENANLTANATNPPEIITENVLFDYFSYVDVGNGGFTLNTGILCYLEPIK